MVKESNIFSIQEEKKGANMLTLESEQTAETSVITVEVILYTCVGALLLGELLFDPDPLAKLITSISLIIAFLVVILPDILDNLRWSTKD